MVTRRGVRVAWSGASVDNVASNYVSAKLGYENLGPENKTTAVGQALFTRQRLAAQAWKPMRASQW